MGLFDALGGIISADMERQNNKQVMQYQYDIEKNLIQSEREWNLPENQLQRLKDAGINPSSAVMGHGTGQMSGNTSMGHNGVTALPTDFSGAFANVMSALSNSRLSNAKAKTEDLLREERYKNIKLENQQYVANIEKLGVDTKAQQIANDYASAQNEVALMKSRSDIGLNYWQMAKCQKELQTMQFELEKVLPQSVKESISRTNLNLLEQDKVVAEIERIFYQNAESEANVKDTNARTALTEAQTQTEEFKQKNLQSDTDYTETLNEDLTNQIQLFLDTYDQQVTKIATDAKISKKQAQWYIVNTLLGNAQSAAVTTGAGVMVARSLKGLSAAAKIGF